MWVLPERVQAIAFTTRQKPVVKKEQRAVADHGIGRRPKWAFRFAVSPDNVSRFVGHDADLRKQPHRDQIERGSPRAGDRSRDPEPHAAS